MEIFLIRHTTPDVLKGTCYGQSDLDVTDSFHNEAAIIQQHLPQTIEQVYSSPLQRCSKLASRLFPAYEHFYHNDLMELHCGEWEMKLWDDIPKEEINPWMKDFVNVRTPGGESYTDLYTRVAARFEAAFATGKTTAFVTHAGVIRSILAHITGTALVDSFTAFNLYYGCVVKVVKNDDGYMYSVLSNIETPREQHKPSSK